jgi:RNA methyltransferase, TrmH family
MTSNTGPSPFGEGSARSSTDAAAHSVITSRRNPLLRDLRALLQSPARRRSRCVVEGWRSLQTAEASGVEIQSVIYTPAAAADPRGEQTRRRLASRGTKTVLVSPYVFESLTQVESPQGVLGLVRRPPDAPRTVLQRADALLAVLDGVQDPGNVGAILRTAAAAAATAGIMVGAAADPYGPKAIRASAGVVFHLPLLFFASASEAATALHRDRITVLVADPQGDRLHTEIAYPRPLAIVFGSEGGGPSPVWKERGVTVRMPMAGSVESLGVTAAAAVLLYAAGATGSRTQG